MFCHIDGDMHEKQYFKVVGSFDRERTVVWIEEMSLTNTKGDFRMDKKYELIKKPPARKGIMRGYRDTEMPLPIMPGLTLYRIRALKSFGKVRAGDIGGFVQSEANLSHEGDCWIHGDSRVYLNGKVEGDEQFCDYARMW